MLQPDAELFGFFEPEPEGDEPEGDEPEGGERDGDEPKGNENGSNGDGPGAPLAKRNNSQPAKVHS